MTDPYFDLYTCLINLICGSFFFIIYYGILLLEKNKNKFLVYLLDFVSVLILGILYLFILDSNKIDFHIYHLIFITSGYWFCLLIFKKQLFSSYYTLFSIINYLTNKLKVILHWSFDIIPIKILLNFIKKQIIKYKVKKFIKNFNKKIIVNEEEKKIIN